MKRFPWRAISGLILVAAASLIGGGRPVVAEPASNDEQKAEKPGERFLRVAEKDGKPEALEVAIVQCVPKQPGKAKTVVELISAVHVGEPSYYDALNERFKQYDAVLYEMVAPKGTRIEPNQQRGGSPVSTVQHGMADMLDLEFQLNGIDYQAENLVHADMSPDELAQSMEERNESVLQMFLRTMGYAMAQQQQSANTDAQMLAAFFSRNRALALRRAMAQQFNDMPGMMRAIEGPKGSSLIGQRNKKALEELRRQIDAGKERLAIFYGGGHMRDMVDRLEADFNLVPKKVEWIAAWDLADEPVDDATD